MANVNHIKPHAEEFLIRCGDNLWQIAHLNLMLGGFAPGDGGPVVAWATRDGTILMRFEEADQIERLPE